MRMALSQRSGPADSLMKCAVPCSSGVRERNATPWREIFETNTRVEGPWGEVDCHNSAAITNVCRWVRRTWADVEQDVACVAMSVLSSRSPVGFT